MWSLFMHGLVLIIGAEGAQLLAGKNPSRHAIIGVDVESFSYFGKLVVILESFKTSNSAVCRFLACRCFLGLVSLLVCRHRRRDKLWHTSEKWALQ